MGQEILSYVIAANAQKDLYYNEDKINKARELVAVSGFEEVVESQHKQLADFLAGRKIKHDTTLEQMVKMPETQVSLLGAAFYFSRKFFATSHDCGEEIQNPVPLIQNVFDALAASDERHAARFLEDLSEASSKEPNNQRKIVAVVAEILPEIHLEYVLNLRKLELNRRPGSTLYNDEKALLDKNQMALLDKVLAYAKHVIRTYQEPSLSNFRKYANLEKTTNGSDVNKSRQISINYLQELAASHRGNYIAAIVELEEKAGTLIVVNDHRERNGSGIKLTVGTGVIGIPRTNQLIYSREDRGSDTVYRMLLAICDRILANPEVPTESKTTTAMTRQRIVSYQTRG